LEHDPSRKPRRAFRDRALVPRRHGTFRAWWSFLPVLLDEAVVAPCVAAAIARARNPGGSHVTHSLRPRRRRRDRARAVGTGAIADREVEQIGAVDHHQGRELDEPETGGSKGRRERGKGRRTGTSGTPAIKPRRRSI